MLVARCLVDPFNDRIPLRVANLENFPLKLKKNLMLGEMHPVKDFCCMDNTDAGAEVCSNNRMIFSLLAGTVTDYSLTKTLAILSDIHTTSQPIQVPSTVTPRLVLIVIYSSMISHPDKISSLIGATYTWE
jgi:hypothetical protein